MNSSLEELIKITVIFILRQGMFRLQNLPKSVMFLTHIRAFLPCKQWFLRWLLCCWLYCVTTVTPFIEVKAGHFDLSRSWTSCNKNAVFFAEIQIRCKFFQLRPKRETSSSSLGDRLEKRSIISPLNGAI